MRSLDQAIRRYVAAAVKHYCPACLGTKVLYLPQADGSNKRVPCQRCEQTGTRK